MAKSTYPTATNPLILRFHRLLDAFAKSDDERDFYLDKVEGFILLVDLDKSQEELDALEKEFLEHGERYILIPKMTFYESRKFMEGFVNEKVYDIDTKEKLLDIIGSKESRENFLEFIYDNLGEEGLKNYFIFNQDKFFELKMSAVYKLLEAIIKKLPKGLKMKEGLKLMVKELQFLESPKNIVILERTSEKATFEVTKCSFRKEYNKLAKKSHKPALIDRCCLWCMESIPIAEKYGFKYLIELTKKGCLNYLS